VFVLIVDEPSQLSAETRKEMGIIKQLPRTAEDAWKFLQEDKEMLQEFGEEFVDAYLSVKQVTFYLFVY